MHERRFTGRTEPFGKSEIGQLQTVGVAAKIARKECQLGTYDELG